MGIIRPSTSNQFQFSNASDLMIVSNSSDGSMGFEHDASGIPFVRTDTSFSGTHDETVDNAGTVELDQYEGWDDVNAAADETLSLEDTTSWDTTNGGEVVFDYILNLTGTVEESSLRYFDGVGIYESVPYSVGACRRVYSDSVTKQETIPSGTVLSTEVALSYDGGVSYLDWQPLNGALFPQGEVLEDVFVKYRVLFEATTDGSGTPNLSEWKHALDSYTVMKIEATGEVRYAASDYTNYNEVI